MTSQAMWKTSTPVNPARPAAPTGAAGAEADPAVDELLQCLYAEHATALFAYVRRMTGGDRQLAEDVVQETMLRAWRSAHSLDPERPSLRPWLFTVARRIVIDHHRNRSVRPTETGDDGLETLTVGDEIEGRLSAIVVSDALNSLSPAHKAVIVELYYRGSKVDDAARTLGVPSGTVKSRAYYALRALRLALEERGMTSPI
jgi:RNA polymerase sigma-70 factor, ECF subfamily